MVELPEFLISIPGTPHAALRHDTRLTARAMSRRSIIDVEIADLPEVQALGLGDVVLDIGAFIGDTAILFLDRGCDVWAFEPYPDAFAALRINCPAAHNLNVAVGDGKSMQAAGKFGENDGNHGSRMLSEGGSPTLRIDDLFLPRVDFIKLDVEGCEPMVLAGMRKTIRRYRPKILVEVYDGLLAAQGFTRGDVLEFLVSEGYRWRVAVGQEEDERLDYLAEPQ